MQFVYIRAWECPGISWDFQDFPMLKVPPPPGTLYKRAARKVGMLAFVESQLKCITIIETLTRICIELLVK